MARKRRKKKPLTSLNHTILNRKRTFFFDFRVNFLRVAMFRYQVSSFLVPAIHFAVPALTRTLRIKAHRKVLTFVDLCGKNQKVSAKIENIFKKDTDNSNVEFKYAPVWTAEHNNSIVAEEVPVDTKTERKQITEIVKSREHRAKTSKASINHWLKDHKQSDVEILYIGTLLSNNLRLPLYQSRCMSTNAIDRDKSEQSSKKELFYENTPEIQAIHQKYPIPKQTFHNFYQIIGTQIKDKSSKPTVSYKLVKDKSHSEWLCTVSLKWPDECKIYAGGKTKQTAFAHAALRTLQFLEEENKITKEGMPIVYSKEDVKRIIRETSEELDLSKVVSNMQNIVNVYNEQILPHVRDLEKSEPESREGVFNEDSIDIAPVHNQRFLGLSKYLSKEKVDLPVARYKEQFMELLDKNNVIIIKGEPGCGKSTRIPQYVLEYWASHVYPENTHCRIAVAQPRKIAAISLAERVSSERDELVGSIVGYQVRFQKDFNPNTGRILYCTSGILIRHLQSDPNLKKLTHVILDESHERDVNTDLLMSLLKNTLKTNPNFKLIIMSATIDTDEFQRYYDGSAVLKVPGFTYPVQRNFLDDCPLDLSKTLKMCESEFPTVCHEDIAKMIEHIHRSKKEGAVLVFLPGWDDIVKVQSLVPSRADMAVYCLHSKLKNTDQMRIFRRPPPGVRKVILSTNIAETSITIDDVVYVVDSGIFKNQFFDSEKGINVMDQYWISKANVSQRAGRAGRCQPGESFHMYPKSKFESFRDYKLPDILGTSLSKIVLDSKMFNNNKEAVEFMNELPTPPEKSAVVQAVRELKDMELLDKNENLTSLGRTLVQFQLEPKLAKTMVNAVVYKCVTPIIDIVTLFSSDVNVFNSALTDKVNIQNVKRQFSKTSDHLAMMRILEKWIELVEGTDDTTVERFCRRLNLASQRLEYISKIRAVHFDYLYNGLYETVPIADDLSDNDTMVLSVLFSGLGTVLLHRNWDVSKSRLKINTNRLITKNKHKATIASESVNFKRNTFPSKYLVYMNETRSNVRNTTLVRECSLIPTVSVLLFSNKDLYMKPIEDSSKTTVGIKDTHIACICDKSHAETLEQCKKAMKHTYDYLIHQLTHENGDAAPVSQAWQTILTELDGILKACKVE